MFMTLGHVEDSATSLENWGVVSEVLPWHIDNILSCLEELPALSASPRFEDTPVPSVPWSPCRVLGQSFPYRSSSVGPHQWWGPGQCTPSTFLKHQHMGLKGGLTNGWGIVLFMCLALLILHHFSFPWVSHSPALGLHSVTLLVPAETSATG